MSLQEQHEDLIKQIKIFCHTRFKAEGDGVLGTHDTAARIDMDAVVSVSFLTSSFGSQLTPTSLSECCLFHQVHGSTFSQHSLITTNNTLFG